MSPSTGSLGGKPAGAVGLMARLVANIKNKPATNCWIWQGSKQPRGYGWVRVAGRSVLTHRAMWEASRGKPLPAGKVVKHTCDTPACINPRHLRLATQRDNLLDKGRRGRDHNTNKTHCPRGHAYVGENLRVYRGRRFCAACNKIAVAKYRSKQ